MPALGSALGSSPDMGLTCGCCPFAAGTLYLWRAT
jgi:hypothetical protein